MTHPRPRQTTENIYSQTQKEGISPLLLFALGLGAASLVALFQFSTALLLHRSTKQSSLAAATVEIREDGDSITISWTETTTGQAFWLDRIPMSATCDAHTCKLFKRPGAQQVYLQWLNSSENRWYYFQSPADYRGSFQGIPYSK